ncbi:hypothetical protein PTKU46_94610 [Paraburkholderia terrae]
MIGLLLENEADCLINNITTGATDLSFPARGETEPLTARAV